MLGAPEPLLGSLLAGPAGEANKLTGLTPSHSSNPSEAITVGLHCNGAMSVSMVQWLTVQLVPGPLVARQPKDLRLPSSTRGKASGTSSLTLQQKPV